MVTFLRSLFTRQGWKQASWAGGRQVSGGRLLSQQSKQPDQAKNTERKKIPMKVTFLGVLVNPLEQSFVGDDQKGS
jgi:hypothetical protein